MRPRFVLLALLVLAVSACAAPQDHARRAAAAATGTTAAAQTTAAGNGQAKLPPPGLVPAARRQPAPALRVNAFDGRTVTLEGLRGRPVVVSFFESWCPICQCRAGRVRGCLLPRYGGRRARLPAPLWYLLPVGQ